MNPISAIFGAAVSARNALYDRDWLQAQRLRGPVISVGNLSTGGAGKTPFVIALGELLQVRGVEFDVLTRGYGRSSRGVARVEANGSPRQFGDEPILIARRLGVPVFIGEKRYEAGLLAERTLGPRLHLLDDGFQHRQLARDFDIVLITPEDQQDQLLPVGRLREPFSALRRAHAVVLTPGASAEGLPLTGQRIWQVRRGICPEKVPVHPVAFCGIARPCRFFTQLREAGITSAAELGFRDHHAYQPQDIAKLLDLQRQSGAKGFVTTEKDAVNLGDLANPLQPLAVIPMFMELSEPQGAIDAIMDSFKVSRFQSFKVGG